MACVPYSFLLLGGTIDGKTIRYYNFVGPDFYSFKA